MNSKNQLIMISADNTHLTNIW